MKSIEFTLMAISMGGSGIQCVHFYSHLNFLLSIDKQINQLRNNKVYLEKAFEETKGNLKERLLKVLQIKK